MIFKNVTSAVSGGIQSLFPTQPGIAVPVVSYREQPSFPFHEQLERKIFIHFAKLFVIRFPKWQLAVDENDPLCRVKIIRPDIVAAISDAQPYNMAAVYGGPDSWARNYKVEGMYNPVVATIPLPVFYGWAIGIDAPEWIQ